MISCSCQAFPKNNGTENPITFLAIPESCMEFSGSLHPFIKSHFLKYTNVSFLLIILKGLFDLFPAVSSTKVVFLLSKIVFISTAVLENMLLLINIFVQL